MVFTMSNSAFSWLSFTGANIGRVIYRDVCADGAYVVSSLDDGAYPTPKPLDVFTGHGLSTGGAVTTNHIKP